MPVPTDMSGLCGRAAGRREGRRPGVALYCYSRKVVGMWKTSSAPYLAPPAPGQPDAWTAQTQGRGSQRILEAGYVEASAEVAEALRLEPGAGVIRRTRLILIDREPVEIVTSHYPSDLNGVHALAQPRPVRGGTVWLLADLGWVAARAVEDVSAETATADLGGHVPQSVPLLVTRRTLYTAADVPFEYTVMTAWDGRRQRYIMEVA